MPAPSTSTPGREVSDPVRDVNFDSQAQAMAEHAYGVMRLYCMEYGLKKEHVVHAVARMCVSLRESYPDGKERFDALAADAQSRMEAGK